MNRRETEKITRLFFSPLFQCVELFNCKQKRCSVQRQKITGLVRSVRASRAFRERESESLEQSHRRQEGLWLIHTNERVYLLTVTKMETHTHTAALQLFHKASRCTTKTTDLILFLFSTKNQTRMYTIMEMTS